MGVRDLFQANSEILLDEDSGLSESWTYTPPTGSAVTGDWIFDEDNADAVREVKQEGEEIIEYGLLDLPLSISIDHTGKFTRASDSTVWKIHGVVGRDLQTQTIRLSRVTTLSTRQARRRGI